jgi:hypothetical protein
MQRKLITPAIFAILCAACGGGGSDPAKDEPAASCAAVTPPAESTAPPHTLIDLTHWSLTLPVDASGNHSGTADSVSPGELVSGYSSEWFHSTAGDGVMFFAPVQGATTAHTVYPRSELREMMDPGDSSINWTTADTAEMLAYVAVHQAPSANGKITIGEIVGYNGTNPDVNVLAKLVYEYNATECLATLYTLTLPSPTASGSTASRQVLSRSVPPGQPFSYSLRVENKQVTYTAGMATVTENIGAEWDPVGLYFRAGAALWANGSSLTDGARVTFYQLDITHP